MSDVEQRFLADYGQYLVGNKAQGLDQLTYKYADGGNVPAHELNLAAWNEAQAKLAADREALKDKPTYQPGIGVTREGNTWIQETPPSQAYTDYVSSHDNWTKAYNQAVNDFNAGKYNVSVKLASDSNKNWDKYYSLLDQGYEVIGGQGKYTILRPKKFSSVFSQAEPTWTGPSGASRVEFAYNPAEYEWSQYGERMGKKPTLFGGSLAGMGNMGGISDPFRMGSALKMAQGGYVKGYAQGDLVEGSDDVQTFAYQPTQIPVPNFTPIAEGQVEPSGGGATPVAQTTPQLANINPELYALMQQYTTGPDYSAELKKVGEERRSAEAGFNKALETAMSGGDEGPSKAELYFRLAAAFGTPTKTGHFGESLAQAAGAMGDYSKEHRVAQGARRKLATEIALKKQELLLEGVKDREKTLLALQSENSKDRREAIKGIIKEYIDSGKPQSEAGKIAKDKGFKVGTPEYQEEVDKQAKVLLENKLAAINATLAGIQVQQGRLALETKKEERAASELDPSELKLLTENKQAIKSTQSALDLMDEAATLADKAFTKSTADQAEYKRLKTTDPQHPRVVATEQLEQILTTSGLAGLRSSFGGNPTEGERQVQLLTQGLGATSAASRKQIINRVKNGLVKNKAFYDESNADLLSGSYKKKPVTKE